MSGTVIQFTEEKSRRREAEVMAEARNISASLILVRIDELIKRASVLNNIALGASIIQTLEKQIELSLELISREEKGA